MLYKSFYKGAGGGSSDPMTGATAGTAGTVGTVPAPSAGDQGKFLRGDATWQAISGGGDMLASTYDPAGKAGQVLTVGDLLDEDDFTSNSATKAPSQQSVKAYVDTGLGTKAASSHTHTLSDITDAGTAAAEDVGYFATAAQGALADSALQSVAMNDLTDVTITGAASGDVITHNGTGFVNQAQDATLVALAGLDSTVGALEQTGTDTFAKFTVTTFAKTLLDDTVAGDARGTLSAAARAQTLSATSMILGSVADGTYTLVLKSAFAGTITETTTKCTSGTATATFKVNTTALGGTANSVSSSEQSQSHASSNTFAADDDIVVTISSASSLTDLIVTVKYTVTLS